MVVKETSCHIIIDWKNVEIEKAKTIEKIKRITRQQINKIIIIIWKFWNLNLTLDEDLNILPLGLSKTIFKIFDESTFSSSWLIISTVWCMNHSFYPPHRHSCWIEATGKRDSGLKRISRMNCCDSTKN